jgi:hypothetical protein
LLIGHKKKILMIKRWFFGEFFLSFEACIEGFKYYRSPISVDETYLYGWYDGKLLIGVFYANNEVFIFAFVIIDEENNSN